MSSKTLTERNRSVYGVSATDTPRWIAISGCYSMVRAIGAGPFMGCYPSCTWQGRCSSWCRSNRRGSGGCTLGACRRSCRQYGLEDVQNEKKNCIRQEVREHTNTLALAHLVGSQGDVVPSKEALAGAASTLARSMRAMAAMAKREKVLLESMVLLFWSWGMS